MLTRLVDQFQLIYYLSLRLFSGFIPLVQVFT